MDRQQVEEALNTLIGDIQAERGALSEDSELTLQNVRHRVDEVCNAAVKLPDQDAVAMQGLLRELKACLSSLSAELETAIIADQDAAEAEAMKSDGESGGESGKESDPAQD